MREISTLEPTLRRSSAFPSTLYSPKGRDLYNLAFLSSTGGEPLYYTAGQRAEEM